MDRSSSSDLAARIARLESSTRRDRAIVLAVVILALVTAQASGAPSAVTVQSAPIVVKDAAGRSATLSAKGLTVRDVRGRPRAFVGVDDGGRPSVDLTDSAGTLRESMYLLRELPVLRQFDRAGKRRAEMRLDSSNDGELLITDEKGKIRLALFRTSKGDPQLGLYGTDERLRAYFGADDASPYLVMRDKAGTTRVYMGGYQSGTVGIDVRNAADSVLWRAR
jgi:hypothetical protein